jgi:hypothetical protein
MPDDELLGPVELAVLEFPGSQFKGEIVPALAELVSNDIVRILDLVFVTKNADGSVDAIELSDLGDDEAAAFDDLDGEVNGLLSDSDLELAAEVLDVGSSAALIVWENTWARRLVSAIANAGGRLVAHDRLDAETVRAALADSADT